MVYQSQIIRQGPGNKQYASAHLAQTMTLLSKNNIELASTISTELAQNPALEHIEDNFCPNCHAPLKNKRFCQKCYPSHKADDADAPIVMVSSIPAGSGSSRNLDLMDDPIEQNAYQDDLPTFVMKQIASDLTPEEAPLAAHILTSLDDDGLLEIPISEIAIYHHKPLSKIKAILQKIQRSDPIGVGSQSSSEALLAQIDVLGDKVPYPELTKAAISSGLENLNPHKTKELAQIIETTPAKAKLIISYIVQNLNPYPARAYWGSGKNSSSVASNPVFSRPDVILREIQENGSTRLVVEILSAVPGIIRINPLFKTALKKVDKNKTDEWKSDLEKANLLVKCLKQRNHTLVQLMDYIVRKQKQFILKGNAHSISMTRAQIAEAVEVHESTISRAVSSKTCQLPNGKIIPLSVFFDRSLNVRTEMIDIINSEEKPYSDTAIAKLLKERGYTIARRTVAKYRSIEGILPAHLRKKPLNGRN